MDEAYLDRESAYLATGRIIEIINIYAYIWIVGGSIPAALGCMYVHTSTM